MVDFPPLKNSEYLQRDKDLISRDPHLAARFNHLLRLQSQAAAMRDAVIESNLQVRNQRLAISVQGGSASRQTVSRAALVPLRASAPDRQVASLQQNVRHLHDSMHDSEQRLLQLQEEQRGISSMAKQLFAVARENRHAIRLRRNADLAAAALEQAQAALRGQPEREAARRAANINADRPSNSVDAPVEASVQQQFSDCRNAGARTEAVELRGSSRTSGSESGDLRSPDLRGAERMLRRPRRGETSRPQSNMFTRLQATHRAGADILEPVPTRDLSRVVSLVEDPIVGMTNVERTQRENRSILGQYIADHLSQFAEPESRPAPQEFNSHQNSAIEDVCCICLASLDAKANVVLRLACSHRMHESCLAPWVVRTGACACPTCRRVSQVI
mmetsp:Transcript_26889/g.51206  ORF Transcript_26889/g.51206 Transcript_26889/m.51206 type:complete len:388 (-) Transcript_26889:156-1319(-)